MNEKAFRTQYDRERVRSGHGDPVHILYEPVFDSSGHMELRESGRENIYDYIQSHKESTDINLILQRFAKGDAGALSRRQGMYGDFTQVPNNYADLLNKLNAAEAHFNSLPVSEREKFGHSFAQFISSLGDIVLRDQQPIEKPVEDPVNMEVKPIE